MLVLPQAMVARFGHDGSADCTGLGCGTRMSISIRTHRRDLSRKPEDSWKALPNQLSGIAT
jgi:hypothetical protein